MLKNTTNNFSKKVFGLFDLLATFFSLNLLLYVVLAYFLKFLPP